MSKICARLRNIITSTNHTVRKPSKIPKPNKPSLFEEFSEEPNLKILANKLIQTATESHKFRNRYKIYDLTISRLAIAKRFNLIEDIINSHKHFDNITKEGYAVRLISFYGKSGMFENACKLFDELPQLNCVRTVKSFTALLRAGVYAKRFNDVFRLFEEIPIGLSIECNVVAYNVVIHGYCEKGELDKGLLMVDKMKERGVSPNVATFNTLLDGFYKEKGLEGGDTIWGLIDEYNVVRDICSYNLRMEALVKEGEIEEVMCFFEGLESVGLKPDLKTFNVLIKKCCDQGDVGEAKEWYYVLVESGATPNGCTFCTLVPKLCDSGDFDLAFELCKKMFKRKFVVDEGLLQLVVDKFVEGSMVEEAKELVELGKSYRYFEYNLVLPSDSIEK